MTIHNISSLLALTLLLAACSDGTPGLLDSGTKDRTNLGDVRRADAAPSDTLHRDGSGDTGTHDVQIWEARTWEARTWDTSTPDTGTPDTAVPDSAAPDSAAPDSAAPDSAAPDSAAPDSAMPDSAAPDSAAPDSAAPDSAAPDAAVPDSAAPDSVMPDSAAPDTMPAGPCVPGVTEEVMVPGAMVACVESTPTRTQCNAAALCGPGWHLCTASEYKAHFTVTAPPITKSYWLASCVRAGGDPFAPVDAACSFCGGVTGSTLAVGWACTVSITVTADKLNVGVRAATACGVVGVQDNANEAYWQPWPTDQLLPGSVCCN